MEKAEIAGVNAYITKPFDVDSMLRTVSGFVK